MIVVIYQSDVVRLSFLCIHLPLSALFKNLALFHVEMSPDYRLKAFWRVPHIFNHCILNVRIPDDIRISFVLLLTFLCALLVFKAWFIEIYLLAHDDCLNRE